MKSYKQMNTAEKELMEYMSNLSEEAYCAGWMSNLEYTLWEAVVEGPLRYGFLEITNEHIERLKQLSSACGGWVIFDDEVGEAFVPMQEWLRLYEPKPRIEWGAKEIIEAESK